jgi:hypothetical protein
MKRAGTILRLAAQSYVDNTAEHHKQTVIVGLNRVGDVAAVFNTTYDEAMADKRLTPAGQRERMVVAADTALTALKSIEDESKKASDRATNLEKALRAKVAPPKDVSPETLREIRDQMRHMTPDERMNVYRTSPDPRVRAAIETGPPALGSERADGTRRFEPFVDAEELSAAQLTLAREADPVAATHMDEFRHLAEVYRLAVNGVRHEIAEAMRVSATASVTVQA